MSANDAHAASVPDFTPDGLERASVEVIAGFSDGSFQKALAVRFFDSEPLAAVRHDTFSECWTIRCKDGLTDGTIRLAGLSATMTDVLVRLEYLSGSTQVTR